MWCIQGYKTLIFICQFWEQINSINRWWFPRNAMHTHRLPYTIVHVIVGWYAKYIQNVDGGRTPSEHLFGYIWVSRPARSRSICRFIAAGYHVTVCLITIANCNCIFWLKFIFFGYVLRERENIWTRISNCLCQRHHYDNAIVIETRIMQNLCRNLMNILHVDEWKINKKKKTFSSNLYQFHRITRANHYNDNNNNNRRKHSC